MTIEEVTDYIFVENASCIVDAGVMKRRTRQGLTATICDEVNFFVRVIYDVALRIDGIRGMLPDSVKGHGDLFNVCAVLWEPERFRDF